MHLVPYSNPPGFDLLFPVDPAWPAALYTAAVCEAVLNAPSIQARPCSKIAPFRCARIFLDYERLHDCMRCLKPAHGTNATQANLSIERLAGLVTPAATGPASGRSVSYSVLISVECQAWATHSGWGIRSIVRRPRGEVSRLRGTLDSRAPSCQARNSSASTQPARWPICSVHRVPAPAARGRQAQHGHGRGAEPGRATPGRQAGAHCVRGHPWRGEPQPRWPRPSVWERPSIAANAPQRDG